MVFTKQQIIDVEQVFTRIFQTEKQDIINAITDIFENKIKVLTDAYGEQVNKLKTDLQVCRDKIMLLENKNDDLEQYSRRNNARFFGIKEEMNENVEETVLLTVEKHMDIKIPPDSISRCHRIGKAKEGKARPIIINFTNYKVKEQIFRSRKMLKGKNITIHDDLTKKRLNLLNAVRDKYGIRNTWTRDGNVFARNDMGVQQINEMGDM